MNDLVRASSLFGGPRTSTAGPSGVLGTVANPPPEVSQLAVGTTLRGVVVGHDGEGHVLARTQLGTLAVATKAQLPVDSEVTLQIRSSGTQLHVLLMHSESRGPQGQGTLSQAQNPAAQTAAGGGRGAQGGAAQQSVAAQGGTPDVLTLGQVVRAVVQAQASSAASPGVQAGAGQSAGPELAAIAAQIKPGSTLQLRILSVQAQGASPAALQQQALQTAFHGPGQGTPASVPVGPNSAPAPAGPNPALPGAASPGAQSAPQQTGATPGNPPPAGAGAMFTTPGSPPQAPAPGQPGAPATAPGSALGTGTGASGAAPATQGPAAVPTARAAPSGLTATAAVARYGAAGSTAGNAMRPGTRAAAPPTTGPNTAPVANSSANPSANPSANTSGSPPAGPSANNPSGSPSGNPSGSSSVASGAPQPGSGVPAGTSAAGAPGASPAAQPAPATAPSEGALRLTGTVTGVTHAGQPVLSTPLGTLTLEIQASIPPGSRVALEFLPQSLSQAAKGGPAPGPTSLGTLAHAWPALDEALQALQDLGSAAGPGARSATAAIPQPGTRLASGILFFLAALGAGDMSRWFGPQATQALKTAGRDGVLTRLGQDFGQLGRLAEASGGDWRTFFIPFLDGDHLQQLRMFLRHGDQHGSGGGDGNEDDDSTRFVVELELSHLGDLQLDGLVRERRFDLILRTRTQIPDIMRRDISQIFHDANEAAGYAGNIGFHASADWHPMPIEAPAATEPGLTV